MRIWIKTGLILLLLIMAEFVYAKNRANIYEYSRAVPQKEITGESGNKVKLDDFNGDFVIAVFWSRYCGPCIRELKSLSRFARQTRHDGIRVVMISPKGEWAGGFDEQRRFLRRFDADELEAYVDEKEKLASALGIFSSPVSVLVSRDGQEIGRIRGSIEWDKPEVIEYIYKVKADKG